MRRLLRAAAAFALGAGVIVATSQPTRSERPTEEIGTALVIERCAP